MNAPETAVNPGTDSGPEPYRPYSELAHILRHYLPDQAEGLPTRAYYAACATTAAIATVGQLLMHCDTRELDPADIRDVGDLVATLGSVALELVNAAQGTAPA